jgi:hypothetical protein
MFYSLVVLALIGFISCLIFHVIAKGKRKKQRLINAQNEDTSCDEWPGPVYHNTLSDYPDLVTDPRYSNLPCNIHYKKDSSENSTGSISVL